MYEYRVIKNHVTRLELLEDQMNDLIEKGYEFVSIACSQDAAVVVMKRKRVTH
jgi:hypothetical protein